MALPVNGSTHLISAYYSIYRPRKMLIVKAKYDLFRVAREILFQSACDVVKKLAV